MFSFAGIRRTRKRALPAGCLQAAARGRVLETLGLITVFLMLNVIVGVSVALAARTFGGSFVSA